MAKWLLIGILALPVAEIAVFILVAAVIGLPWAFGLLLAGTFAGAIVLRHAGRARIERLRGAVTQSGLAGLEAGGNAFMTVAAGILLLLPGFISDVCGILLLLPPVRHQIAARFQAFIRSSQSRGPASVVDLGRDEWNQVPEQALDDPRRRNDLL